MNKQGILEKYSEEDLADLTEWISGIKKGLRIEAYEKSKDYGFDFENDRPLTCPDARFRWDDPDKVKRDSVRISKFSTLTSFPTEEIDSIPKIAEFEDSQSEIPKL